MNERRIRGRKDEKGILKTEEQFPGWKGEGGGGGGVQERDLRKNNGFPLRTFVSLFPMCFNRARICKLLRSPGIDSASMYM